MELLAEVDRDTLKDIGLSAGKIMRFLKHQKTLAA